MPSFSCCPCVAISHFQFPAFGMYVWELTPAYFWNSTERNSVAVMWVVFLFFAIINHQGIT